MILNFKHIPHDPKFIQLIIKQNLLLLKDCLEPGKIKLNTNIKYRYMASLFKNVYGKLDD